MTEFTQLHKLFLDFILPGIAFAIIIFFVLKRAIKEFDLQPIMEWLSFILIILGGIYSIIIVTELLSLAEDGTYIFYLNRATGIYWFAYLIMILSNTLLPFSLIIKKLRNNPVYVLLIAVLMNSGRILEWTIHQSISIHTQENKLDWMPPLKGFISGLVLVFLFVGIQYFSVKLKSRQNKA